MGIQQDDEQASLYHVAKHIDAQEMFVSLPFPRKGKQWQGYDRSAVQVSSVIPQNHQCPCDSVSVFQSYC